jgi:hypothetical protein
MTLSRLLQNLLGVTAKKTSVNRSPVIAAAKVRLITSLESLLPIKVLPQNIYGYSLANPIVQAIRNNRLNFIDLNYHRKPMWCFEVQRFNDRCFLIGYISENSFIEIINAKKNEWPMFTLLPIPWEYLRHIVAVPLDEIIEISERCVSDRHKEIMVLDIKARQIPTTARPHTY